MIEPLAQLVQFQNWRFGKSFGKLWTFSFKDSLCHRLEKVWEISNDSVYLIYTIWYIDLSLLSRNWIGLGSKSHKPSFAFSMHTSMFWERSIKVANVYEAFMSSTKCQLRVCMIWIMFYLCLSVVQTPLWQFCLSLLSLFGFFIS